VGIKIESESEKEEGVKDKPLLKAESQRISIAFKLIQKPNCSSFYDLTYLHNVSLYAYFAFAIQVCSQVLTALE